MPKIYKAEDIIDQNNIISALLSIQAQLKVTGDAFRDLKAKEKSSRGDSK